jgi:WD40 repeat protein
MRNGLRLATGAHMFLSVCRSDARHVWRPCVASHMSDTTLRRLMGSAMRFLSLMALIAVVSFITTTPAVARARPYAVAAGFSTDNKTLFATWSDGSVTYERAGEQKLLFRFPLYGLRLLRAAFSADGSTLAIATGNEITIFRLLGDLQARASESMPVPLRRLSNAGNRIYRGFPTLSLTADGTRLLTSVVFAQDSHLFDVQTGKELATLRGKLLNYGFTGRLFMLSDVDSVVMPGMLALYDSDGKLLQRIGPGTHMSAGAMGDPDMIAITQDNAVIVIDVVTGKTVRALGGKNVPATLIRSGNQMFVASSGQRWRAWSVAGDEIGGEHAAEARIEEALPLGKGRVVLSFGGDRLVVADARTGRSYEINRRERYANPLAVTADGSQFVFGGMAMHVFQAVKGRYEARCLTSPSFPDSCEIAATTIRMRTEPKSALADALDLIVRLQRRFESELEAIDDGALYLEAVERLIASDRLDDARAALEWLVPTSNSDFANKVRIALGKAMVLQGDISGARALIAPIADLPAPDKANARSIFNDCNYCDALDLLADLHLRENAYDKASATADRALDARDGFDSNTARKLFQAVITKATALGQSGKVREAQLLLLRLIELRTWDARDFTTVPLARLTLGEITARHEQFEEGDNVVAEAVDDLAGAFGEAHPLVVGARTRQGALRFAAGRPLEALVALRLASASLSSAQFERIDRFRNVFRLQVAADWQAAHGASTDSAVPARLDAKPEPKHRAALRSFDFSSDGSRFSSTDKNGRTIVWRTSDISQIASRSAPDASRAWMAADGRSVEFANASGFAWAEGVENDDARGQLPGARRFLVGDYPGPFRIVDTGGVEARFLRPENNSRDAIQDATLADDKLHAAFYTQREICVVQIVSEKKHCTNIAEYSLSAIAFGSDSQSLWAVSYDGRLRQYAVATLAVARETKLPARAAGALAVQGDRVAVALDNGAIIILDSAALRIIDRMEFNAPSPTVLKFGPAQHLLLCGTNDGVFFVWDILQRRLRAIAGTPVVIGHRQEISSAEFAGTGDVVVSASADGTVRAWNWRSAREVALAAKAGNILAMRLAGGSKAVVLNYAQLTSYDVISKASSTTELPGSFYAGIITRNGIVAGLDYSSKQLKVFDAAARPLYSVENAASSLAMSPDGARMLVFDNTTHQASLLSIATGRLIQKIGKYDLMGDLSDKFGVVVLGNEIQIFDTASGRKLRRGMLSEKCAGPKFVMANGSTALLYGARDICLVYLRDLSLKKIWADYPYSPPSHGRSKPWLTASALSKAGGMAALGFSDGTVRLFDVRSGRETSIMSGHSEAVSALAFRDDEHLLASGSADRTIAVWDTRSGVMLGRLGS